MHRLVKRLYGRTNKWNATMQISKHVQCLEWAQLAPEHQKLKEKSRPNLINDEEVLEKDLDVRYQISHSKNDPVDIWSYIRTNQGDSAFKVGFYLRWIYQWLTDRYETGFHAENWRITYLGVYWSESSMVIPMASLRTRIGILSEYRVNAYIAVRHFGLTIQPTIFSATETR